MQKTNKRMILISLTLVSALLTTNIEAQRGRHHHSRQHHRRHHGGVIVDPFITPGYYYGPPGYGYVYSWEDYFWLSYVIRRNRWRQLYGRYRWRKPLIAAKRRDLVYRLGALDESHPGRNELAQALRELYNTHYKLRGKRKALNGAKRKLKIRIFWKKRTLEKLKKDLPKMEQEVKQLENKRVCLIKKIDDLLSPPEKS